MVHVEKSPVESSVGTPRRNNKWVNLSEEHKYGLALSVSGGSPSKQLGFNEVGDNGRRYLESTTSTSAKDSTKRDGEHESIGMETLNGSGFMQMDHKDDDFGKVGFYCSTSLGIEEINAETSHNRCGNGSWDLEANEAEPKIFFLENKLRRFRSRTNVFGFFCNLWAAYGSRVAKLHKGVELLEITRIRILNWQPILQMMSRAGWGLVGRDIKDFETILSSINILFN